MFAVSARLVGCLLTASVFAGGCSAPPRADRSAAASQNTCADKFLVAFLLDGTPPPHPFFTRPANS